MGATGPAAGTRIVERAGESPTLVLDRTRLAVTSGPDEGREMVVDRPSLRVGTAEDSDLILSDETISARHFELHWTEAGCLLRDLGSTNGTRVDGYRVGEIYLPRTARIVVGNTELTFESLGDEVRIPISRRTNFGELLGHSPAMRAAFAALERVARTESTVLLYGESGTGKELAARGLHDSSARSDGPFVVFDCGVANENLIASQLFGHARGAFTGAVEARQGVFESADGGTLVLDELGELPLALQPTLLRALETRTIQRVGETTTRAVDVRFVACTNRNLDEEVRAGRFRQDLFFRMSVISIRLPPLRDRLEEIPRLARHFLTKLGGEAAPDIPPSTMKLLLAHSWPGNVRELRNFVERFLALGELDALDPLAKASPEAGVPAPDPSLTALPFHEAKQLCTDRFERDYLKRLLEKHGDNLSEAARVSGLSRQSCYRLMHKHGLRVD